MRFQDRHHVILSAVFFYSSLHEKDLTAGFCGKTVIHPKQIDVLNDACRVLKEDLADAENILSWSSDTPNMVNGSQTARDQQ